MRLIIVLLGTLLISGCVNPTRMCGVDRVHGWEHIRKAPTNEDELLALVEQRPLSLGQSRSAKNYWFRRDSEFLLCRADPEVASDGCFSAGWVLSRLNSSWHSELSWESICTG